ncbi:protein of unknown function [Xenorhabdus doucetiae]|uniref:Uncharacterized protein n=1 Tax=Xenorhabdus doucetiae TaxID=351671 RepID=A0A068QV96_9GAMM|nr:protein of unknown function [Xenorhabdus doucetiae]
MPLTVGMTVCHKISHKAAILKNINNLAANLLQWLSRKGISRKGIDRKGRCKGV